MDIAQRILNGDELTSHGNVRGRKLMLEILEAGLRAADPYNNTLALMRIEGRKLIFGHPEFLVPGDPTQGDEVVDLDQTDRILVLGAGKGIQRSARAIEDVLGDRLTGGHVIDKHGGETILERIGVTYGAHPVPDEGCVLGCQRILELTRDLTERDLVITLAANGISSLLTLPAAGVSLEDVRKTTHLMQIQRGAPTGDLNPVRNHLDQMKGGRLARHIQPARAIHIMVWIPSTWDALMHRNTFIHSLTGATTFATAMANLKKWDAWDEVPQSVRDFIARADPRDETVKADEFMRMRSRVFGVMPLSMGMLPTAKRKAEEFGLRARILYDQSNFEACQAGLIAASVANTIAAKGEPVEPPCVLLGGGELIVTVGKESGMGGRNQEWALSAARRIAGNDRIVMASVDSDGTDGPGHQFSQDGVDIPVLDGGIVDGCTMAEARAAGFDVDAELRRHNTSPILHKLGCGVRATHNISMNDLTVVMVLGKN